MADAGSVGRQDEGGQEDRNLARAQVARGRWQDCGRVAAKPKTTIGVWQRRICLSACSLLPAPCAAKTSRPASHPQNTLVCNHTSHFTPTCSPPTPLHPTAISVLAINSLFQARRWASSQQPLRIERPPTSTQPASLTDLCMCLSEISFGHSCKILVIFLIPNLEMFISLCSFMLTRAPEGVVHQNEDRTSETHQQNIFENLDLHFTRKITLNVEYFSQFLPDRKVDSQTA